MGSRKGTSGRTLRSIRACLLSVLTAASIGLHGQTDVIPSSVDLRLVQGASHDQLLMQMRIHSSAGFGGILSGVTVTIRYDASSGASLGAGASFCNAWSPFPPSPVVIDNGTAYRTYNGFGLSRLEDPAIDGGCGTVLAPEEWFTITAIPVAGDACTAFILGDDAFTSATNRNAYVSFGGHEVLVTVTSGAVDGGDCNFDCLGVEGGTALPGTPCDDGDPATLDDAWTADCTCVGNPCDAPQISGTTNSSPVCADGVLQLAVLATGTPPLNFAWSGSGTIVPAGDGHSASVTGASTGDYSVTVTNACGSISATLPVLVHPVPSATIGYGAAPICSADGTVQATFSGMAGGLFSASPAGLAIDPSSGAIDPGNSAAGSYTATYAIAAAGGCDAFSATAPVIIEEAALWYADTDGDGAGDPAETMLACEQPAGYVAVAGDLCPNDPDKVAPGTCGCGVADTDSDQDGIADCIDSCPQLFGEVGDACDDGDPETENDMVTADCDCVGTVIHDCPALEADIGDACDDGDPETVEDVITAECMCEGDLTTGMAHPAAAPDGLRMHPNPNSTGTLVLELSAATGPLLIELQDLAGRVLLEHRASPQAGQVVLELPARLPAGIYLVQVAGQGQRHAARLVLQR